jgi:hypothetical protein
MKEPEDFDAETARELLNEHAHEPEEEEVEIICDMPRPDRDDRDPYGRIERRMLYELTGSWEREAHQQWKDTHPEFAAALEAERHAHPETKP